MQQQTQQSQLYLFVIGMVGKEDSIRITLGLSMSAWYLSHESGKARVKISIDESLSLIASSIEQGHHVSAAVNGAFRNDARLVLEELRRVVILRRSAPRIRAKNNVSATTPIQPELHPSQQSIPPTSTPLSSDVLPAPADDLLAIFREKSKRDLRDVSAEDLLRSGDDDT